RPAAVTPPSDRLPAAAAVPLRFGENRIGENRAGRLYVMANRNLDQAVGDAPLSGAQPRAGSLDLDRLRFGHQDGARSLIPSHVNPDTSVLVDAAPRRARWATSGTATSTSRHVGSVPGLHIPRICY